jgi:hypothetical protein
MSTLALPLAGPDPTVSYKAVACATELSRSEPATVFRRVWSVLDAYREASLPDWDGYGAVPVPRTVMDAACCFLAAVPETWPSPEVYAEPDGELSFEWARGPHWVFSVSVGRTNRLSYAGLFGSNRVHGVESFAGTLPEAIVVNLARLLSSTAAVGE